MLAAIVFLSLFIIQIAALLAGFGVAALLAGAVGLAASFLLHYSGVPTDFGLVVKFFATVVSFATLSPLLPAFTVLLLFLGAQAMVAIMMYNFVLIDTKARYFVSVPKGCGDCYVA